MITVEASIGKVFDAECEGCESIQCEYMVVVESKRARKRHSDEIRRITSSFEGAEATDSEQRALDDAIGAWMSYPAAMLLCRDCGSKLATSLSFMTGTTKASR